MQVWGSTHITRNFLFIYFLFYSILFYYFISSSSNSINVRVSIKKFCWVSHINVEQKIIIIANFKRLQVQARSNRTREKRSLNSLSFTFLFTKHFLLIKVNKFVVNQLVIISINTNLVDIQKFKKNSNKLLRDWDVLWNF